MKKIQIVLLLIIPFILTGCASTLKCEIATNNYKSSVKIKFKNDKPVLYKYKDEMIYTNNLSTDSELYYHSQYTKYSYLIADNLAKVNNFSNKVSVKIDYNFDENKSQGENSLLISRNDTIKNATKKIESSGYICK